MRGGFSFLFLLALVVFFALLVWSVAIGWLLGSLLDFSLFEGALLAMFSTAITAYVVIRIITGVASMGLSSVNEKLANGDFMPLMEDMEVPIAGERFYKSEAEKTWENWIRYNLANDIYRGIELTDAGGGFMDAAQRRELAVRLSEISVAALKSQSQNKANRPSINVNALKRQMEVMELQPYDRELLEVAVEAVRESLDIPVVVNVIKQNLWEQRTPADF